MSKAAELAALIGSQTALSNRNLVINGAMQVAQRGTSESSVTTGGYKQAPDRFKFEITSAGTWTISQSTTAPEGFSNSYKIDCTAADASLAAGDLIVFQHFIEGQNLQQLKKGTGNAESITLSFWVRSAKTGTYVVEIADVDNTRHIGTTYTISSADTWEYKKLTFAGDTSGALDNDNAKSLELNWWLAAGSTFSGGTLPASWASQVTANRAAGVLNLADSTSNDWYITGIQLEVGEQATPFEHRPLSDELLRCFRYYYRLESTKAYTSFCLSRNWSTTNASANLDFKVPMRSNPTFTSTSVSGNFDYSLSSLSLATNPPDISGGIPNAALNLVGSFTNGGAAHVAAANTTSEVFLAFDAEL